MLNPKLPIYLTTGDDLTRLTDWLADDHGCLTLDVETTGLDVRAPGFEVRQVALAGADGSAIVLDGRDANLVRDALRLAMSSTTRPWWAHCAQYDRTAIASAYGVQLSRLRCSMTLVQTVEPDRIGKRGATTLKALRPETGRAKNALFDHYRETARLMDRPNEKSWLAEAVAFLPPDDPFVLAYVATDAVECARLVSEWSALLTGELRAAVKRETEVDAVWTWPGFRGYRVDTSMLNTQRAALAVDRAEALEHWGLDLTSSSNATRAWVAERGIRITTRKGENTLSVKEFDRAQVPADVREDWAAFRVIREGATAKNKLNELARCLGADRLVYPNIKAIGAHTGRQSISGPALQNLPGRLRPILLAEPGMVLVGCDLDRVEPRVVAALSGDAALKEGVQGDIYRELAVSVWGEDARFDENKRQIAKTAFLAMLYGQGSTSLGLNLDISRQEAQAILNALRAGYPVMAKWMARIERDVRAGHTVYTGFGRPTPDNSEYPRRAVNHVVQGTAADLFKNITLAVVERLGIEALWLPVHDELIVQVPVADAEKAAEVLRECMTTELRGVPITGTPVILGDRWVKA